MYKCKYCPKTYKNRPHVYRHQKVCEHKDSAHSDPVRINVVAKDKPIGSGIDKELMIIRKQMTELSNQIKTIPAQNITQITNNNNINVYFNKDLKYYPELVKLLGRQKTCDYLLFTMPESRDIFGVFDKLFVRDGVSCCPIKVSEDDEFVIARNNNEFVHDPTGELIDRENKSKLQDAVLSAYIDSTKHLDDECEKIRKNRVNGEYSEQDMETINRRFDSAIEPSRPYEVMDIMNGIKPKKKDFDRLRKMCPKITKKIVT